jgi:hypothetical protein
MHHLATTAASPSAVIGLPEFACAPWFYGAVNKREAWELASRVDPTERIVKVEFFLGAGSTARMRAEKILTSSSLSRCTGYVDICH